jgi:hypothetical protein
MGRATLTEYLLRLSTDPEALDKHSKGTKEDRERLMTAANLKPEHKAAVESGDKQRILTAVQAELKETCSIEPGTGTPVTFEMACCVSHGPPQFMSARKPTAE